MGALLFSYIPVTVVMFYSFCGFIRSLSLPCTRLLLLLGLFTLFRYPVPRFCSLWGTVPSLSLPCTSVLLPFGNHSLSFVTLYPAFAPFGEPFSFRYPVPRFCSIWGTFSLFRYPVPRFCSIWGTILSLSLLCTSVLLHLGNHSLSFVTLYLGFAHLGNHSLSFVTLYLGFAPFGEPFSLFRYHELVFPSLSQPHINFHPSICMVLHSSPRYPQLQIFT